MQAFYNQTRLCNLHGCELLPYVSAGPHRVAAAWLLRSWHLACFDNALYVEGGSDQSYLCVTPVQCAASLFSLLQIVQTVLLRWLAGKAEADGRSASASRQLSSAIPCVSHPRKCSGGVQTKVDHARQQLKRVWPRAKRRKERPQLIIFNAAKRSCLRRTASTAEQKVFPYWNVLRGQSG